MTLAATATIGNAASVPSSSGGYPIEDDGRLYRYANDNLHRRSLILGRLNTALGYTNGNYRHSLGKRSPINPITQVIPGLAKTKIFKDLLVIWCTKIPLSENTLKLCSLLFRPKKLKKLLSLKKIASTV